MNDMTPDEPMNDNERTMQAFCNQFTPPLRYVRTQKINNIKFPNAYTASYWDSSRALGITAVCYEGQIHAFIEVAGTSEFARGAGAVMARALELIEQE
jgi:hypothetical protein